MRLKYYLSIVTLIWIYLLASAATSVYGAEKECDANICEEKNVGFICAPGSVIVIQEVMCRTRGSNCDLTAYQQVTRLCAGRLYCDSTDLLTVSDQYCERNDKKQFLSIVFVSYVCVEEKAIESDCNDAGRGVSSDHRYLSSPGYPALVTGNSVCTWRLQPPPGLHTDIFIREYLHLDNTGQQLFSIREVATDSDVLNLEKTAKRDLTTTIGGDVEISLHTDESLLGHRVFIEYRYVKPPLEHLRPFPVPNKTECGESLVGKTFFPDNKDKTGIKKLPSTATPSPTYTSPTQSTQTPTNGNKGVSTTTKAPAPPNVKETDLHEDDSSKTELIVAISVCAVGLACCVVAIWITCRHRKKKASMNKRNCLATDTYSVEYDRASLGTTPSVHPYSRPAPIVTTPGHQPYPVGRVDFIRQSETVQFKNGFHSPHEPIIEASPADETFTGPQRFDRNGDPLDLSKYLITGSENLTGSITSQTSSRSSNGHIYEAVREH